MVAFTVAFSQEGTAVGTKFLWTVQSRTEFIGIISYFRQNPCHFSKLYRI